MRGPDHLAAAAGGPGPTVTLELSPSKASCVQMARPAKGKARPPEIGDGSAAPWHMGAWETCRTVRLSQKLQAPAGVGVPRLPSAPDEPAPWAGGS